MNSEQLATQIKLLRTKSGLRLRAAARRADIGVATLSAWESGRSTPSPAALKRFLSSFGLSELEVDRLVARRSPTGGTGTTLAHAGVVLTALRDQAGMTLRELATLGQVEASTLLRWERGESAPTSELWSRVIGCIPRDRISAIAAETWGHVADTGLAKSEEFGQIDPEDELPDIFARPDHLYEHALRGYELLARRNAAGDPRWWDWLALLQYAAISGFIAKGSLRAGHHWARQVLRGHPGLDRHPALRPALTVFVEVTRQKRGFDAAEKSARQLVRYSELPIPRGAQTWALQTAASSFGQAGCPIEATRLLDRILDGGRLEEGSIEHLASPAHILTNAGLRPKAMDWLEERLPTVVARYGTHDYVALWSGFVYATASIGLVPDGQAVQEVNNFIELTYRSGAMGAGWRGRLLRELPKRISRQLRPDDGVTTMHG